jgi:hypothetical protein
MLNTSRDYFPEFFYIKTIEANPHLRRLIHCEKSLFVLASRQKITVLRTENPAVDTRTICLPPIAFFKIPHARKATAGKSRPKSQIRSENPGLLVPGGRLFTFPCLKI